MPVSLAHARARRAANPRLHARENWLRFRPCCSGKTSGLEFETTIETVGKAVDIAGVAAIVVGVVVGSAMAALDGLRSGFGEELYRVYRQRIGRAILLGLELLVAADIIRTVAVAPTFTSVGVLAAIVLVRTFLSFTLELELSGRWPWQRRDSGTA